MNKIIQHSHRIKFWAKALEYKFIHFKKGSQWTGKTMSIEETTSLNAGSTWKKEKADLLYGSYYFMAGDLKEIHFSAYNIVGMAS